MAYNKSKHVNAAQKYLQQGKLPQAIAEYQQILKNEPKDQITLMTLGDLYVRQGETFQALEYFERLAKIFLNDGFTTKAIAIYKKVAKLAPEETRPLERLAELYVQQGVMSEARPIYLQLAEVQLKAGNQQQAAALFRKLLEAEPDNQRVHVRLAELQLSMGQQKEAAETFYAILQRILERGDNQEAIRLADRILQLEPGHVATTLAKVRALSAAGKAAEAMALLESFPDSDEGKETTSMLLDQYRANGQAEKAIALAERVYARDPQKFAVPLRVANELLDAKQPDNARKLLSLIRNTMADGGEHDALSQALSRLAESRPADIEPLEWLVDLYGRASDSFRLPDALAQLASAYESAGDLSKAIATYEKLLERTPEDETSRRKYVQLRAKTGLGPIAGEIPPPVKVAPPEVDAVPVVVAAAEPSLDEETQRYVTQALTDVDLFSSYGLTQKAIDLLEAVVERAPRHVPVLERLLDLSVGAGNDRRTVELATLLEQIANEQGDRTSAERYSELRRRFQKAAPAETPALAEQQTASAPEFSIPVIAAELDEPAGEAAPQSVEVSAEPPVQPIPRPVPAESVVHEVDLSDEWAALSEQIEPPAQANAAPLQNAAPQPPPVPAGEVEEEIPVAASEAPAFELELQAQEAALAVAPSATTAAGDAVMADLAADFDSFAASLGMPVPDEHTPKAPVVAPIAPSGNASAASSASRPAPAAPASNGNMAGPLTDLFEEFRSALGEAKGEDEDLETHYNLGIAYREMGLLEEAISEFQKVASSGDHGPAFRYAMQCSTLLGLAFMEKGQPAIAAIWYERALKTPGLDPESVLALKYDLGVAQELAGDTQAAFNSFSQVYAMNIDYRDVSERIALLGKAR